MTYKGIYQKKPEIVEFIVILIISLIAASIFEKILAVKEVNIGSLLYYIISIIIKIFSIVLFSIIYYAFLKKKPSKDTKKD